VRFVENDHSVEVGAQPFVTAHPCAAV
jgi:hypothetical protein